MTKPIADQILDLIAAETAEKAQDEAAHDANIAALKAALATVAPPAPAPVEPDPPAAPAPGTVPSAPIPGTPVPGTPPATPPAAPVPVDRPDLPSLFDPASPLYTDKIFLPDGDPIPVSPNQWKAVITSGAGSTNVYVAIASDPPIDLHTSNGQLGDETAGVVLTGDATMRIEHWPPNVVPGTGGDNDVVIVDIATRKVISAYQVAFDGANWSARDIAYGDLDGSGFGSATVNRVGICAGGTSPVLGLVLKRELGDGTKPINHMLRMAIGEYAALRGPVPPCYAEDGPNITYKGKWAMGRIVMIDPKFDVSQFQNLRIRQIAMTLQTKGAVVTDTCGDATPFAFYYEIGAGVDFDWQSSADTELLRSLMVPVKFPQSDMAIPAPGGFLDGTLLEVYKRITKKSFGFRSVSEAVLAAYPQDPFVNGDSGPLTKYQPQTGERPDLGDDPEWCVNAIVSGDPRAAKYIDNVSRVATGMQFHFRDKTTGAHFDFEGVTLNDPTWGTKGNGQATFQNDYPPVSVFVTDVNLPNTGWTEDNQHTSNFLFVPALEKLRTKDLAAAMRIVDESIDLSIWMLLNEQKTDRGFHRCIISPVNGSINDERGAAHGILQIGTTAVLMNLIGWTALPVYKTMQTSIEETTRFIAETFLPDTPAYPRQWPALYNADGVQISEAWDTGIDPGRLKNTGGWIGFTHAYDWEGNLTPYSRVGWFQQCFATTAWQMLSGMMQSGALPVSAQTLDYAQRISKFLGTRAVNMYSKAWGGPFDGRRGGNQYDFVVGMRNVNDNMPDFAKTEEELAKINPTIGGMPPLPDNENPPIIRAHNSNDSAGDIGAGYTAMGMACIPGAIRDGVEHATDAMAWIKSTLNYQQSRTTIAAQFNFAVEGDYYDDAPVVTAPVPAPAPAPAPVSLPNLYTFDPTTGTRLCGEGETAVMPADGLAAYGDGTKWFALPFSKGVTIAATNAVFGDPNVGVTKSLYFVGKVTAPVVTPPAPTPPAPTPVVPVTGDPVDPTTWLKKAPSWGFVPVDKTLTELMPADQKWKAVNEVDQWAANAYLPDREEIAESDGGHQNMNVDGAVYTSLRTLTRRFFNKATTAKTEASMPADGTPDEQGIIKAMHGFNGHEAMRKAWGLVKDYFGVFTLYYGGPTPFGFYDPDVEFGGGDTIYKGDRNKWLAAAMGYAKTAASNVLNGFFAGDAWHYHPVPQMGAIVFDRASQQWLDPDLSWPNPMSYGNSPVLLVDDERRLLIAINGGDSGYPKPTLNLVGMDPAGPNFRQEVELKFAWPADVTGYIAPDRFGFAPLTGKGICGIGALDTGEVVAIQIKLGANPFVDAPTITVPFRGLPLPPYGMFGKGKEVAFAGEILTVYDYSQDGQPVYVNWPNV